MAADALPPPRGLIAHFTRHKTLANIVLVMLICAGLAAMPRLRAQFFPDSIVEEVTVSVVWDGAGAEDVDRAIVQVLEPSLLVVEGVEATESRATERCECGVASWPRAERACSLSSSEQGQVEE